MGFWSTMIALDASSDASQCAKDYKKAIVVHHVTNGGCLDDFKKAMDECRGRSDPEALQLDMMLDKRVVDVEACVKATAALRECFTGNPAVFKHQYLRRMDEGLDQDTNPSRYEIWEDKQAMFRWWTGMRRS